MKTKHISFEEFIAAEALGRGSKMGDFTKAVIALNVGEGIKVEKADWKLKTPPSDHLQYTRVKRGYIFKTKTLADGTGWLIVRLR